MRSPCPFFHPLLASGLAHSLCPSYLADLTSDSAAFTTGVDLKVDGGYSECSSPLSFRSAVRSEKLTRVAVLVLVQAASRRF